MSKLLKVVNFKTYRKVWYTLQVVIEVIILKLNFRFQAFKTESQAGNFLSSIYDANVFKANQDDEKFHYH